MKIIGFNSVQESVYIEDEIKHMQVIDHPHIVKYYGRFKHSIDQQCLLIDFCEVWKKKFWGKVSLAGPIFGWAIIGPAKVKKKLAGPSFLGGPINDPAIIPGQQNWPNQYWVSSQTLAQPKSGKNWPSQILAADLVLGFSPTLEK